MKRVFSCHIKLLISDISSMVIPIYVLYVISRKLYCELYIKETYISKCIEALKARVLRTFRTKFNRTSTQYSAEPVLKPDKMQFSNRRLELVKLYVCSQEWFFFIPLLRPEVPTKIEIGCSNDTPIFRIRFWRLKWENHMVTQITFTLALAYWYGCN